MAVFRRGRACSCTARPAQSGRWWRSSHVSSAPTSSATDARVTITRPPEARPADGLAIDFVVASDRAQLGEIVRRVRDGRLRTNIGTVATLDDAVAAFNPTERISGQTIIRVRP